MNCESCTKEILPDSVFCTWCNDFVPSPAKGKKANLFRRWVALALDPLIAVILYLVSVGILTSISKELGAVAAIALPLVYLVWFLSLLPKGLTPGKKLMGLQVVDHQTGTVPGFGKMFVREIVGRFISGLFGGLGYFWAIFDKNSQAWHDKIAGTVVLRVARPLVQAQRAPSGILEPKSSGPSSRSALPSANPTLAPKNPTPTTLPPGTRRPAPRASAHHRIAPVLWAVPALLIGIIIGAAAALWWVGGSSPAPTAETVPSPVVGTVKGVQQGPDEMPVAQTPLAEPRNEHTRQQPGNASMMSDLRNLVTAEEAYFADSVKYTSKLGASYSVTSGNATPIIALTTDGWTATIGGRYTAIRCAIFIGSTSTPPAIQEGAPRCTSDPMPVQPPAPQISRPVQSLEQAHVASMKSDLRNLVTAEEAFFAHSIRYSRNVVCATRPRMGTAAWCATSGNTLGRVTLGTGRGAGWTASITNIGTTTSCAIYIGAVVPAAPASTSDAEGAPVCRSTGEVRAASPSPAGATPPANGYSVTMIQPSKETSAPDSAAQLRPYLVQFAFLIGEWECLTPGNHYRMRVTWDGPNKQFQGYLTKQGQVSENVGFQLGELVWTAQPSAERVFIERQKWRYGANRIPSDYQWRNGNFDVERSSQDHLVSSQEFMRVR